MKSLLSLLLTPVFIKIMRWLYGILLLVVIVLSLIPTQEDLPGTTDVFRWLAEIFLGDAEYSDKVSHFLAYGTLTGVGLLAFIRPLGRSLLLPLAMLLLSGLLELAQGLVSSRMPDWLDFVANGTGVAAGGVIAGCLILAAQAQHTSRNLPA